MSALKSRSPVSRTTRTLVSVLAGLGMVLLGTTAPPAHADDAVSVGIPNWSGLDVTEYSGPPIPAKAGTLISQVPLAEELNLPPAAGDAYRIQYSSLNQHGKMATGTGAVFLPKGKAPAGGWPVISWAHGTVGMNDDCTPSAFPRSERDQKYLGHWLQQGYAVVAADYVGLGTPRPDGLPERRHRRARDRRHRRRLASDGSAAGQALGNHRTVAGCGRRVERGGSLRHRVQPWIGSGLPRVVATGIPANLEYLYQNLGPVVPPVNLPGGLNAYTAYILAGFNDTRPDMNITKAMTPKGIKRLAEGRTTCYPILKKSLAGDDVRTWFRAPLMSIPGLSPALHEYMATPYKGYDRPIFLGQGLRDVDVPAPSALSLYAQMKANNQPVELFVYPEDDHSSAVLASMKDSTPFVARILR